jgi:nicotinate-nucleotide adenylyltransferase
LRDLRVEFPAAELFLLIGADVVRELHTWRRVEEVRRAATLGVWRRAGVDVPELDAGWRVAYVDVPCLELSSTELRARAAAGRSIEWLVPAGAVRLIRERGLYAGGE